MSELAVAPSQPAAPARVSPSAITLEHAAYALIVSGGLLARLLALGAAPLSPAEAAASWPAWLDAWAVRVQHLEQPTSALLHAMQLFLFWVTGGGGDALARLPVALASSLLPLLPWFWRRRLGRVAALALALLLALDPWLLALGRTADGAMLSATLGLTALTALEVHTRGSRVAAYVASVASGLLLVSGPQAWNWLAVLALYWLLARPARTTAGSADVNWRGPAAAGAAAAILGATGWLAQPQELAMVSASLGAWLAQGSPGPHGFAYPWLRLLVDQPFVLLFAPVGLVVLWKSAADDRGGALFLTAWLAWGILLLLLPGRSPYALPLLGVPLQVCAALGVAWLWQIARGEEEWRDAGLLALVVAGVLLALLFWAAGAIYSSSPPLAPVLVVAAMLAVLVLLLAGFALFAGARQTLVVGLGVSGLFVAAASLSATWQLVYDHDAAHPDGFFAAVALPDANALPQDVAALSFIRTGDATELPVQVITGLGGAPDPQVGWLLRAMRNVRYLPAPQPLVALPGREPLIVTPPQAGEQPWSEAYAGSNYRLRAGWLPGALPGVRGHADRASAWSNGWRPWLRWLFYREATPAQPGGVTLWATP